MNTTSRLKLISYAFVGLGVIIGLRLFTVQVLDRANYEAKASKLHIKKFEIPPKRGTIYVHDRDKLVPVALNQTVQLLYVDPSFVKDKPATAAKLAEALKVETKSITDILAKESEYEVIKRELSAEEEKVIGALKLPGVVMYPWHKRVYPDGEYLAQVLGFVNQEGVGQYGIEKIYDKQLAGTPGLTKSETDANGVPILTSENIVKQAADGSDIVLSIDRNIQSMAEIKMRESIKKFTAEGGSIVIEESSTGRILAMASMPSFNPNDISKITDYKLFDNPATDAVYEPGSVFKIFTMGAGIESGAITPDTTFNDTGKVAVDGLVIENAEHKGFGIVNMTTVLEKSLNVGTTWVVQQMGGGSITPVAKQKLYDYVKKFGFGDLTGIESTTESSGFVNKPESVAAHAYAAMAFGQSVSVTPVQLTNATNAIANGGKLLKPRMVDAIKPHDDSSKEQTFSTTVVREVVSSKTAAQVGAMMVSVVEHGTGWRAKAAGYGVAGKTGTAQIPLPGGGYDPTKNEGSFVGFAPVESPRFSMLVKITKPHVQWAESSASPVFGELNQYLLSYLQVPPTR